jgi:hypothetical protein
MIHGICTGIRSRNERGTPRINRKAKPDLFMTSSKVYNHDKESFTSRHIGSRLVGEERNSITPMRGKYAMSVRKPGIRGLEDADPCHP